MLSPNTRSLYTSALTPPEGFVFDEAIGTTFSMDPSVLLTVPVHLALLGGHGGRATADGLAVLESIRRLANRITVYAQRGRLQVPSPPNPLYGLLESMTVEVNAPRGGVFHPKLWVLRFVAPDSEAVLLRLMVLSRNLTLDRSWDVALTLEGTPTGRRQANNRDLGELLAALPSWAVQPVSEDRQDQALRLGDELRRTRWELPPGFDTVSFHVMGRRKAVWRPAPSDRLAIISPFCTDDALNALRRRTQCAAALVSRPDALFALSPKTRAGFGRCLLLDDAAETEDGEDGGDVGPDTVGLHAKVYVFERGSKTHVLLGSANATSAALLAARNVEVLAELTGPKSRVGDVDALLGAEGLGEVLVDVIVPPEPLESNAAAQAAEAALEAARTALARSLLRLDCAEGSDGTWCLRLEGLGEPCEGVAHAKAWPITVHVEHAAQLWLNDDDHTVAFGGLGAASITGLIAFELVAAGHDLSLRFVLNLPVEGLPEARDTAILQTVVRNREGFLRYLLLLLGELGGSENSDDEGNDGLMGAWRDGDGAVVALLEELVRAYSRSPARLREVRSVVERLTAAPMASQEAIIPPGFLELWQVFAQALEQRND